MCCEDRLTLAGKHKCNEVNRYGFFVVLALALWFTWKAVKEKREESESGPSR